MAKSFANHFKRILKRQQSDHQIIVGTVLSVKPIKVSCYDGQWLLTADDLQISNTVMLTVGASVQLAGKNPYTIIGVLSDQDPDEYDPPAEGVLDVTLAGASVVANQVATIPAATGTNPGFMTAAQVHAIAAAQTTADAAKSAATKNTSDIANMTISPGDTVTTANMVMNGYITTSSTELLFEAPLGKLITAASATLTAGTFTVRTINGYAYNKADSAGGIYRDMTVTDYTPTVSLNRPSGNALIRLLNPTKWTQANGTAITNNTPISVIGTFTIKFA